MRALVFGADGFAGQWLVRHLSESGDEVFAAGGPNFRRPVTGAVDSVGLDVRDAAAVVSAVRRAAPEAIYYLAGVSGRANREDPASAIGVSVNGVMNVLAACVDLVVDTRLIYVSTAYVYPFSAEPLTERSPEQPASLYAAAKLAGEYAIRGLAPVIGVELVVARPFNHIGPGQRESFLVPTIARQIAAGEPRVHLRNLAAVRDFTDVRDTVGAYRLLATRGSPGSVYNVASGVGTSTADLVHAMAAVAGMQVEIETADSEDAAGDSLIGDATRLRSLGWAPRHTLTESLRDVVDEWRSRAAAGQGIGTG